MKRNNIIFLLITLLLIGLVLAVPPSFHSFGVGNETYLTEDQSPVFTYNFTANVSGGDGQLTFSFENISVVPDLGLTNVSDYFWISLNSSTGVMTLNSTLNNQTGNFTMNVQVLDNSSQGEVRSFVFIVNKTNDATQFVNLLNQSFNYSINPFEYIINITDEENDIPYSLNITFNNCAVAEWSTRNCTNPTERELFNSSSYSFNNTLGILNISFNPLRNDVGNYTINFTVTDLNNSITPYNASTSIVVNFSVLNVNSVPYFRYVCDNERNTTEDSEFTCWINATDLDEINNLTFLVNYTWFTFDTTSSNSITMNVSSLTDFNASAIINFTSTDINVGNWSVNITVNDTGSPIETNSTLFWFFINNTEDIVSLDIINNQTIYENQTIYVNSTDNDLFVPDKNVKNETLSFNSNTSWVTISSYSSSQNYTTAKIEIDYDTIYNGGSGIGNYTVLVNVTDTASNSAERNFTIQVLRDNAPTWNQSSYVFDFYEDNETYLNLSQYVNDSDGDPINFSFTNDSSFPSFGLNETTGIVNFTPIDEDVGYHNITINATDGKLNSLVSFNLTIYNINDNPSIQLFPSSITNATGNSTLGINASEDNYTIIVLWVHDDDVKIPSNQKSFYNENISVNTTIQGPNINLFNFIQTSDFPTTANPQRMEFDAIFTPNKSDMGSYNITMNITDITNSSEILNFNLTISSIEHAPVISEISDINSSVIESIYTNINATDVEDGNDTEGNLVYFYNFISGTDFINSNDTIFNTTSGELNITFNSSQGGIYSINISINDSTGRVDFFIWNITVYDYPSILSPVNSFSFNMIENISSSLNFSVNHSIQDNLNYTLIINGIIRNSTIGYGNETDFIWNFTSNITDETTCSGVLNLTLNVSNEKLSNSTNWNITINHTNFPLTSLGDISDLSGGSPVLFTLSNSFSDVDAADSCRNQTVGFSYSLINGSASGGVITPSVTNWTNSNTPSISFSASSAGSANYSVTAYEYNESDSSQIIKNISSNNFSVSLTVSSGDSPGGGGATGGGTSVKSVSLKIIVPDPVSVKRKDKLVLPISLINSGKQELRDIVLYSSVAKNGILREDIVSSFDNSLITLLGVGKEKDVTLIVDINTEEFGLYEVTINASVKTPKYDDWSKIYINVEETEGVKEKIIFTEEFIIGNPECIELRELIDEARESFSNGDIELAQEKIDDILESCRKAIEQESPVRIRKVKVEEYLINYIGMITIAVFISGFLYHSYKRRKLRKQSLHYFNRTGGIKERFNNKKI
jgi:hypothetical protein